MDLFLKINSFLRVVLLLIGFFVLESSITSVSAGPINFGQDHYTGISEIYTYDEIESSVRVEVGIADRLLSRVLSVKVVWPDYEVLADAARVAAKASTNAFKHSYKYAPRIRSPRWL